MKKTLNCLILTIFAASTICYAAFVDGSDTYISVANAKQLRDETPVNLKGNIIQNLGDEKYLFSDGTETIIVEIDNEDWGGQDVSAKDTVIIIGEMDKDFWGTEVDVDSIQLVQ